jgi:WD40 repeat protein
VMSLSSTPTPTRCTTVFTVKGFFTAKRPLLTSSAGLTTPIRTVKFSPGGKLLAVAGDSMAISLFDVASGDLVNNLTGHSAIVFSVAWNPVGDHVISGSELSLNYF